MHSPVHGIQVSVNTLCLTLLRVLSCAFTRKLLPAKLRKRLQLALTALKVLTRPSSLMPDFVLAEATLFRVAFSCKVFRMHEAIRTQGSHHGILGILKAVCELVLQHNLFAHGEANTEFDIRLCHCPRTRQRKHMCKRQLKCWPKTAYKCVQYPY